MSLEFHTYSDVVRLVKNIVDCPICKEPCKEPVRPKGCAHRYCTVCFKQSLKEKSKKQCATCRTPILAVTQRGYTQDELFQKINDKFPGLHDEEEEEFDLAAMMARQQLLAAKLREDAEKQRLAQGDRTQSTTQPQRTSQRPKIPTAAAVHADDARRLAKASSMAASRAGPFVRDDGGADVVWPSRSSGGHGAGSSRKSQNLDTEEPKRAVSPLMEPLDGLSMWTASVDASKQVAPRVVQLSILPLADHVAALDLAIAKSTVKHVAAPWDMLLQDLFDRMCPSQPVIECYRRKYSEAQPDGELFPVSAGSTTAGQIAESCCDHVLLYIVQRSDEQAW